MLTKILTAVLVISYANSSLQASTPSSSYYTAGVVEFKRAAETLSSLDQVNNNVAAYIEIITSNEALETDIIIFPEATLNTALQLTYVPDPANKLAPCNQSEYAEFLQKLSCQAKISQKYVVVNVGEKEDCTPEAQASKNDPRPCSDYKLSSYNTNVVFDRNGVVISRYRKYNLYYEPWNITYTPEYGQFDTDFGVKFGHFICFDLLFYTPATELVKRGITDFIFPTMWFSELPFLTAVQFQQSWAYSYDVNLLAAGASNPSVGSTGSGIYAGKNGSIITVMSSTPERKLYVAQVPKKGVSSSNTRRVQQLQIRKRRAITSHMKSVLLKKDPQIDTFTSVPFNVAEEHTHLCHDDLCCHFMYKATMLTPPRDTVSYHYRLVAFDGDRIYSGIDPLGWSVCSIIACINNTMEGCALAFDETLTVSPQYRFEAFSVEANFTKTDNALVMPNSVDSDLMPLNVDSFQFNLEDNGPKKNARLQLLTPRDDLISFGIYVNYFREKSSASVIVTCRLLLTLSCAIGLSNIWR